MQQSKRLAILRELLMRLTGQEVAIQGPSEVNEPETSHVAGPEQKRLEVLQELLRRLTA